MTHLTAQYFLNHRLDPDEIRWQMAEVAKSGYQGVHAHGRPGLLTPFMSDAWWQAVDTILECCRRHGLEFWIWDDDYFPSGLAGGRVVWEDPGLRARALAFSVVEVDAGDVVEVDFAPGSLLRAYAVAGSAARPRGEPADVTPFCGTRRQHWSARRRRHGAYSPRIDPVGPPHWRCSFDENRFALRWQPAEPGDYVVVGVLVVNGSESHPDILRPEGVASFLRLMYEPYAQRYPRELGTVIKGAFTDEPSPGGCHFPWTPRFAQEFAADHGYDLLEHLAHLVLDLSAASPAVRHHYRLTQHRLQCRHYVQQVADWCRAHRLTSSGHLTRTEWLSLAAAWWPNQLRCYQPLDIPCADPLGAAAAWPDAAAYHSGLKVASSAAHLFGRDRAGTDALAVIGDEAAIRDLKWLLDYQMVLGINYFNLHGLSYSLDGPRKDEVPPSLFYQHTEWSHMPLLHRHIRRTCEALSGGRHLCGLAVLYPSTSLGCQIRSDTGWPDLPDEAEIHQIVEALLSHQRDFDFIDEVTLQERMSDAGELRTPEPYRVIVLPHLRFIEERTARCLNRFAGAGGRVVVVGPQPAAIGSRPAAPRVDWADAAIELRPRLDEQTLRSLPGAEVRGEGSGDLFVLRRAGDGSAVTFLFNRAERPFGGTVEGRAVWLPPRGSALLRDAEELRDPLEHAEVFERLASPWTLRFEPNQLPLDYWTIVGGPRDLAGVDLRERSSDLDWGPDQTVRCRYRFMLSGRVPDARLVLDDSAIGGQWRLSVNQQPIDQFERAVVYDCRNRQARIGHALRGGTTPTLNTVDVESSGPGRGLSEVLYLYGSFRCEYRHGHHSLPYVEGSESAAELAELLPWSALGYPTFSGTAVYTRALAVPAPGAYLLDLGRVEDVASVALDGRAVAALAWPPYVCGPVELGEGEHRLEVAVTNGPGNRNRAAGLPAGLLGPVRLLRAGP